MKYAVNRLGHWLGTLLMVGGLAVLLGTGALYGYGQYQQWELSREAALIVPVITPTVVASPTPVPTARAAAAVPSDTAVPRSGDTPTPEPPTATPAPPTATPILPAERVFAPSIGLDSKVVEAPIVNGEWTVPKFVAGHLQGTSQPLQGGNVVLSGHVESISSGNVFASIDQLKPGDKIEVYTRAKVITYVVDKSLVVSNDDVSVIKPRSRETLTLITCTGTWLPLQRDYNSRLVVVANLGS